MNREKVAKSLLKLANELIEDKTAETEEKQVVKKKDPKLNAIVNKIDNAVGADLDSLLTAVLMVMQKNGFKQEANKLYGLFRPIMKRVQASSDKTSSSKTSSSKTASRQKGRKRLTQR